jgi:hypothetical protein
VAMAYVASEWIWEQEAGRLSCTPSGIKIVVNVHRHSKINREGKKKEKDFKLFLHIRHTIVLMAVRFTLSFLVTS